MGKISFHKDIWVICSILIEVITAIHLITPELNYTSIYNTISLRLQPRRKWARLRSISFSHGSAPFALSYLRRLPWLSFCHYGHFPGILLQTKTSFPMPRLTTYTGFATLHHKTMSQNHILPFSFRLTVPKLTLLS